MTAFSPCEVHERGWVCAAMTVAWATRCLLTGVGGAEHNVAGFGTCEGGTVIHLSPVRVRGRTRKLAADQGCNPRPEPSRHSRITTIRRTPATSRESLHGAANSGTDHKGEGPQNRTHERPHPSQDRSEDQVCGDHQREGLRGHLLDRERALISPVKTPDRTKSDRR